MKLDQITKQTLDFYNKNALDYSQKVKDKAPLEQIKKFVSKTVRQGVVLDVGCASGRDARILKESGLRVVGIDLSIALLDIARSLDQASDYMLMDMRHLNFTDQAFDGVYACASFVHLPTLKDAQVALAEFHRVLKPKGILYLNVKKQLGDQKFTTVAEERSSQIPRFFQYFREAEITQLLEMADFTVAEILPRSSSRGNTVEWLDIFATAS